MTHLNFEVWKMIVPVRCFTCGKVLADKYYVFKERVEKGEDPEKVLDDLGVERYCCRRTLLSHVELIDQVMVYKVY